MHPQERLAALTGLLVVTTGAAVGFAVASADARDAASGNVLISYAGAHAFDCDVTHKDSTGVSPKYRFLVWAEWEASSSGSPPADDTSVDAEWGLDEESNTVYQDADNDSNHSDTWVGDLQQIDAWTGDGGSFTAGGPENFSVTAWVYSTHSATWSSGSPTEINDVIEQDWGGALCTWEGNGGGNFQ